MSWEVQTSAIWNSAEIQNLYEHGRGNGFLNGGVTSSGGTDLEVDYTAFQAVVDGTWVSVAGSSVTHDAADGTKPRMDMIVVNSAGTVSIVKGVATAQSASQSRPPLGTLAAGSLVLAGVYIPASASVILNSNVFDKRVMIDQFAEGPIGPRPPGAIARVNEQYATNTAMHVGIIEVNHPIALTQISFQVATVGAAGTLGIALFSNDGQSRLFNETTASISGTGVHEHEMSATAYIPAGVYYIAINPDATADLTLSAWTAGVDPFDEAAATDLNEISGTVSVTAGTIPATFNPDTGVTYAASVVAAVRFN